MRATRSRIATLLYPYGAQGSAIVIILRCDSPSAHNPRKNRKNQLDHHCIPFFLPAGCGLKDWAYAVGGDIQVVDGSHQRGPFN